jgi:excisionase family DNA binding protein
MPGCRSPIGLPPPFSDPRDPPTQHAMPGGGDPYALLGTAKPERPAEAVLLTVAEVAALLRMSEKSVRRRIKEGVIHAAPTGGRLVRISSNELLRLTAGSPSEEP